MSKLDELFQTFLSNIEPDEEAVKFAMKAHEPVREFLKGDDEFGEYFENSFLYGSYKRHTAVGNIKDVDIVVLTNFDTATNEPQSVLAELKSALARHYDDPENPDYQRRSIRINQPLPDNPEIEMTLDIIPAVAESGEDEPLKIPDRELKEWILSHPKGHLEYTTRLNDDDHGIGRFVPLVKMMKWWWAHQCELKQPEVERPKPKGFWIECLTAENFDLSKHYWSDHFVAVLESISSKYTDIDEVPELDDPALPGEKIKTNMTLEEFQVFIGAVNECLALAQQAQSETDNLAQSEIWREIFGDEFPLYDEEETEESRSSSKAIGLGSQSHAKPLQWIENYRKGAKVRIDAYVFKDNVRLGGINSNGRVLSSGLSIKYIAKPKVRGDFEVYWRVVNTGKHAEKEKCLRGDFFKAKLIGDQPSSNPLVNWEMTLYTGKHWIECFIVQDGKCIARSKKFFVNIRNPKFP